MKEFFNATLPLYNAAVKEHLSVRVPAEFVQLAEAVFARLHWRTAVSGYTQDFTISEMQKSSRVLIGLSGGLDSVYHAARLQEQGYEVVGVHIKGLNRNSSSFEYNSVKRIARLLGLQVHVVTFNTPRQEFADNPFKNQLVLSIMLDIGVSEGIYRYALGSDYCTPLSESTAGFTITDAAEVNQMYWQGVQEHFPQAELIFIDGDTKKAERLCYLWNKDRRLVDAVSSCIAPMRYRRHLHQQNAVKYDISLLSDRCGSCYKCCMEYLLLVHTGQINGDKRYEAKCWDVLATSPLSHRPELFSKSLPLEQRVENLLSYGS